MRKEEVIHVQLPIIKIHTETNLTSSMIKLGLGDVFTDGYYIQKHHTFGRLNEVIQKTVVHIGGLPGVVKSKGMPMIS